MRILTIDCGIINLAYCILDCNQKKYSIIDWKVLDVTPSKIKCDSYLKNGKKCNSLCKFKGENSNVCSRHKLSSISYKTYAVRKVKNYQLKEIATMIINSVGDIIKDTELKLIDKILIELQPKINNKMKFVSHVLFSHLLYLCMVECIDIPIKFISAKSKLKNLCDYGCKLKTPYARRKYISKKHAEVLLETKFIGAEKDKWLDFYIKSRKKDDLSDTLLYAMNNV